MLVHLVKSRFTHDKFGHGTLKLGLDIYFSFLQRLIIIPIKLKKYIKIKDKMTSLK